ncbi:hypothetical protein EJ03DRAFT_329559 [Teratosphaeria nubilosa]|uniref:Uncharacterized protein n=1 Tax=Teratosphaeria nubilosa TaxID=161662 RepID=A0A6G1L347_9PEZI|nr:hypothetical protein EJ03DRAFT_329559 [Teratosphaeria nubilosa]
MLLANQAHLRMHLTILPTLLTLLAPATATHHNHQHQQPLTMSKSLNVFKQPLALHSTSPMTGYLRNGYCEVPTSDFGNHAVAAEVTDEFLEFSARQGNDLRPIPGMKGGCKWCLCATRWLEAFEARGKEGDKVVPKVFLGATNEKALQKIKMEDLKAFAVDKE